MIGLLANLRLKERYWKNWGLILNGCGWREIFPLNNETHANSKPFSQVINPFQFDQAFPIHGDNWNLGCVWLHEKPGFEFKVRVLDLAIEREMQNGFHPHPPRNPSSNHDFMDFLYTVLVGKTVLVNSVFFSLLVIRAHARQLFSQKQFKSFLVSPKYWLPKVKFHLYSNHTDQQHHTITGL